jgi:hypothetical protein
VVEGLEISILFDWLITGMCMTLVCQITSYSEIIKTFQKLDLLFITCEGKAYLVIDTDPVSKACLKNSKTMDNAINNNHVHCNIQLLKTFILGVTAQVQYIFFTHSDLLKMWICLTICQYYLPNIRYHP